MNTDKKVELYHYSDFTEKHYTKLIKMAKETYRFISFTDYKILDRTALWRHDIDVSVHRAYALAKIESDLDVQSTFFLHMHNSNYNLFEDEIVELVKKISAMGHELGLHFEPAFYFKDISNTKNIDDSVKMEKEVLERFFGITINAVSIHNPTIIASFDIKREHIQGMVNAYSDFISNHYSYCSDSNCYWRYRRLYDVLSDPRDERLHILTHPSCWTPLPMSPRDRIGRCIDGRAKKQHNVYDDFLKLHNRENIS